MLASPDERPITVWIVEDDIKYRQTIAFLLDNTSGLRCSQDFNTCEELIAWLDTDTDWLGPLVLPNVLLLDINLPGISGLQGLKLLKSRLPQTHTVMLTIRDDADTIYEALRAGASGYLLKNAGVERILAAVREASQGGVFMPAPVARKVLAFFQQYGDVPDYGLSEREKEVLSEMVLGHPQKKIANNLNVSPHTINTHVQHIYDKLHVHSGIEAVVKAIRERLV